MTKYLLILFILASQLQAQVITIDSARKVPLNTIVTVRGVISTSSELGIPTVYFQDPTAGLVGYDAAFFNGTDYGDSVQVTGTMTEYNGLRELQPVSSFTVLDSGLTVVPKVVTTTQIRVTGENYEAQLIKINNVTAVHNLQGANVTTWTVTSSGTNYRIISGGDSCEIRIYGSTNIANTAIPPFPFSVIALASQFSTSYQILPRSLSDFILPSGGGPLLSLITYSNIQQNSVTINWTTSAPADSKVRWMLSDSNYQPVLFNDSVYNASLVTNHTVILSGLRPGKIYMFNVSSTDTSGTKTSSNLYFATQSTSSGTINVYFNRAVDTTLSIGEKAQGNTNFQTKIISRINAAQYSIDMAVYSFNELTQIRDALINAKIRGVKIRFVYDSRTNQALVNDLIAAGIPIQKRNYQTGDIMHNKFFIFDNRDTSSANDDWVWTGSTNVTQDQFFTDANNVIEIQDKTLAAVYTREFEEMWGSAAELPNPTLAKFGPAKTDNVPHIINVNGTRIEAYFSPSDNPSTQIENMIATQTDYTIYFCAFAFTKYSISNAMKSRFNAGRDVKGVFDGDTSGGVFREMKGFGPYAWNPPADVWIDNAEPGILHHKYILIDAPYINSNPAVETGSFNFSNNATFNNDENYLIVYSPRVANLYLQEFYKRYRVSGGTGVIVIGVEPIAGKTPFKFELQQNYPNPFNPKSTIVYNIPKTSDIKLKVYDILGREVSELVNTVQQAGNYKATFDASNLASGIYFYSLFADGNKIDSKKMVLIK
ncbi:MAG: T9SS C-terminal target domain-containing protein [Ignavibacteriae bacterium]|nr:MAG: T9SS C-terminal target domain-containing protein [Ignavibacteriota bacterium]